MSTPVLLWKHAQPYGFCAQAGETMPSKARNDSRPAYSAMVFASGSVMGYLPSEGSPHLTPCRMHALVDVRYITQPTMCEKSDFQCRNLRRIGFGAKRISEVSSGSIEGELKGGSKSMAITLRLAAVVFCLAQFLAGEALARVKVPDYGHLDRKSEAGKPGSGADVERPGAGEPQSAKPRQGCDEAFGASQASGAALWSEVRLESLPRSAELLSLLPPVDASDIVRAAEGVSADGAKSL